MGRLATKWRDELEAESAALEYRMAKERQAGTRPLPERKGSQDAKPTIRQGASGRRQRHPIDARKELIACLKARGLNASARRVCEGIDKAINTTPISRTTLAPLESWQNLVPAERTWVGFYDHPKTRNLVRTYVNKVPPLRTAPNVPK